MQTMDSRIGLDFIVENPEYIGKLAAALDTNTVAVKKQVIELLSALCVHNEEGHARALDTLDHYRKIKGERYRLSLIVKELDHATIVDYQTALVAFINCLIISTRRLADRTRLRNEFIGCHLLPVLSHLRKCAEAEPELAVQLDVFDEQRESDDAQSLQGPHGVDLNSPLDVFYAILKQVADTPQEIPFLSILQHLLRIDPKEAVSDIIWDTAERLVHRATLLENREDAARLLRAPSVQAKLYCHCQHRPESISNRRQSLNTPLSPQPGPPPPPPPPLGLSLPPPPPPPPSIIPPAPTYIPPPAPNFTSPTVIHISTSTSPMEIDPVNEKLPQQEIPAPKIKMKTINWNKIPSNKVIGKNNVWTQVAYTHQHSPRADMDWSEMEDLFCQQIPQSAQSSPKLAKRDSATGDTLERRIRKETTEVTLLDGKRSLNVNIFLKQFRSTNDEIVNLIKNGEHDDIGAEKLRGLLKILPEIDELDMLKSFSGNFNKLGNAEKFLTQLTNLPNYKLRIESMLLKEEFASNMSYLEPSINSMMNAADDLMTNQPLQEVLYMILVAGNFLNSGGYAANAAGVKLSSLQKITDIRANKPNMNLMHYVALQAEKKEKKLLLFAENVGVLEEAAKNTVEQLHNEISALDVRIRKIKKQIDLPTTEPEIKFQMNDFLQMAEHEVSNLQRNMVQLENVRRQLSDFFCEDVNSFKLEECFRIFHGIYIKFRQAVAENLRRKVQEEQANARRKQREELIATKRRQMGCLGGSADSDNTYNDTQIYDAKTGLPVKKGRKVTNGSNVASEEDISIAGSPSVTRRRLGSFNGQYSGDTTPSITGREEKSPDITPNGSLRRRRSRVLSEEDEGNLMEFLRASGYDNNRERKSWGSLDRSWARRARGSATRKRPALLGADFSADRERPSSPSPLAESKPLFSNEEEVKPKEWKQKIECWLQANESDQVGDDSRRQSRRLTNRRSLEMDSESERSSNLETLPEGKQVYTGGQSSYRRVYPDWTPSKTMDNTDVVSAMEVVEEVQPQVKDKSAWRKSNLNVANSTEATVEDPSRHRHTMPRIAGRVNNRKELINSLAVSPASDRLTLYIRNPADDQGYDQNDKADIDQDNIETPPVVRRIFTPTPVDKREPVAPSPCRRLLGRPKDTDEPENIGDGQFDRFSAARRTRRYKRASENVSEAQPESVLVKPVSMLEISTPLEPINPPEVDKESRLKIWQNRLKTQEPVKRNRHQTGIDHEDVKKALNLGVSLPIDIKVGQQRENVRKLKEHDNDEGFEETQSLMSESPSQGASSGGNYDVDIVDSNVVIAGYKKSKENVNDSNTSKKSVKSTVQKYNKPLERSNSARPTIRELSKASVIPRRPSNVRKNDLQTGITRRSVERSNSRNSLVSSRSSLNSATSTNTVKRFPLKVTNSNSVGSKNVPVIRTLNSNINKSSNLIKRNSTAGIQVAAQRPPRPQISSFMKPTTASSTKTNVLPSRLQQPTYRSKN